MICWKCNTKNPEGTNFCENCFVPIFRIDAKSRPGKPIHAKAFRTEVLSTQETTEKYRGLFYSLDDIQKDRSSASLHRTTRSTNTEFVRKPTSRPHSPQTKTLGLTPQERPWVLWAGLFGISLVLFWILKP